MESTHPIKRIRGQTEDDLMKMQEEFLAQNQKSSVTLEKKPLFETEEKEADIERNPKFGFPEISIKERNESETMEESGEKKTEPVRKKKKSLFAQMREK